MCKTFYARRDKSQKVSYNKMVMQYVVGIIAIALGFLIVWKSRALLNFFGEIPFAENKLFSVGGTNTFYKLIGIVLIVIGFLILTGDVQTSVAPYLDETNVNAEF